MTSPRSRRSAPRWPLERVLFALAGTVTLLSAALAALVSTWFLALTAFVGVNQWLYVLVGACPASIVLSHACRLRSAIGSIREGESIADPLRRSGYFPPRVTHMIAVGEKSGQREQRRVGDPLQSRHRRGQVTTDRRQRNRGGSPVERDERRRQEHSRHDGRERARLPR